MLPRLVAAAVFLFALSIVVSVSMAAGPRRTEAASSPRTASAAPSDGTPTPQPGDAGPNRGGADLPTVTPTASPTPIATPTVIPQSARRRVVVLDPGHGGDEIGAAGNGLVEKDSNLEMALRVQALLSRQQPDLQVVLTRYGDTRAADTGSSWAAQHNDLQYRVDLANSLNAAAFVSIHSNGSVNPGYNGVQAWADPTVPLAGENQRLALMLKERVLAELYAWGYAATDQGLQDASCWMVRGGLCYNLQVIGGPRYMTRETVLLEPGGDPDALGLAPGQVLYTRPVKMPAALIELLAITNPDDASVLLSEGGRQAMAKGIAEAITQYLKLTAPRG